MNDYIWITKNGNRFPIKVTNNYMNSFIRKASGKLTKNNIQETYVFEDVGFKRKIEVFNSKEIQNHYDETTRNLLEQIEDDKRKSDIEIGHILDKDGSLLYEVKGIEHEVNIEDYMIPDCKNAIFTHNHPTGFGFSQQDILSFLEFDMYEIRANTPNGKLFILRKGNGYVDTIGFTETFYNKKPTNSENVINYLKNKVKSGNISQKEISKIKTQKDFQNFLIKQRDELVYDFMKENANKYGFVYEVR